jgi:predicted nucleic acid-binding protein
VTVVLDASVVLSLLLDEPAAAEIGQLLRSEPSALLTVNRGEVFRVLVNRGADVLEVRAVLDDMEAADVAQVPLDVRTADLAGALRAHRYRKRDSPISFPDCCAVAYATIVKGVLATCDDALAAVAKAEGVEVKAFSGVPRRGQRPAAAGPAGR